MCAAIQSQHMTVSFKPLAYVEVSSTTDPNVKTYQLTRDETSIGQYNADIIIHDTIVSGPHFQIKQEGGLYKLVHPHPSRAETGNGFSHNGVHYRGDARITQILRSGDIIRIGTTNNNGTLVTIVFQDGSDNVVQDIVPAVKSVQLHHASLTLGRNPSSDIHLDHPQVSWTHARIEFTGTAYKIEDQSSTNHTYINNVPIKEQVLEIDNVIRIGPFKLIFTGKTLEQYDESKSIRIEAYNLTKYFTKKPFFKKKESSVALDDISLVIPPQSFVALVGGSGAGKSTLLNALSGTLLADTGRILYNDVDYYHSMAEFRTQLGYVPQRDIVHKELSVERALYYGAKLRLPSDYTAEQIGDEITTVLDKVDLQAHRHQRISKLSGGQLKRVSIALELLADPNVFFLDEPTSGLDPGLDRKMMELLRTLAYSGKTVVLVTHATENIDLCDYVCFLAPGGRIAYFGSPQGAKAFFNTSRFSEIYAKLEPPPITEKDPTSKDIATQFCLAKKESYQKSNEYTTYITNRQKYNTKKRSSISRRVKSDNPCRQFGFLCQRYAELLKNDLGNALILSLQAFVVAAILLCFIQWGVKGNGFKTNQILICPHTAHILTKDGFPDLPGQLLINSPSSYPVGDNCNDVKLFLQNSQHGKLYTRSQGGVIPALQNFIRPGDGDAPVILFIMAFAATMFGCINAIREIVKEQEIYKREQAVNVGTLPYIFSKVFILGIICLIQSAILVGVVALADPIQHGTILSGVVEVYITIALTSLAGLMMGLAVSALVPNNDWAMSMLPLLLLPQVIFSGTLFSLNNWFLQLMGAFFPIRWAMAALGSSVGLHSDKLNGDQLFGDNYATYQSTLLSTYSQADAMLHLKYMWSALGIMIILFGSIVWIALKVKYRRVRFPNMKQKQGQSAQHIGARAQIPGALAGIGANATPVALNSAAQLQNCLMCGAPLHTNKRFCRNCGARIS